MDDLTHRRHHALAAFAGLVAAIGILVIAVCFAVLVVWMVSAQQNAKLYLDDNTVCFSQPFAIECHPRTKP